MVGVSVVQLTAHNKMNCMTYPATSSTTTTTTIHSQTTMVPQLVAIATCGEMHTFFVNVVRHVRRKSGKLQTNKIRTQARHNDS